MKPPTPLVRRIETLEAGTTGSTESGIVEVSSAELERWWIEQYSDGGRPVPTIGPGIALVGRELTIGEWVERFGSIEHDADPEEQSNV